MPHAGRGAANAHGCRVREAHRDRRRRRRQQRGNRRAGPCARSRSRPQPVVLDADSESRNSGTRCAAGMSARVTGSAWSSSTSRSSARARSSRSSRRSRPTQRESNVPPHVLIVGSRPAQPAPHSAHGAAVAGHRRRNTARRCRSRSSTRRHDNAPARPAPPPSGAEDAGALQTRIPSTCARRSSSAARSSSTTAGRCAITTRLRLRRGRRTGAVDRAAAASTTLRRFNVPVVVRMNREAGLASLLRAVGPRADQRRLAHLQGVQPARTGIAARVRPARDERIARPRAAPGLPGAASATTIAAAVPWDDLPLDLKESNRTQADHIATKLEAIGLPHRAADRTRIGLVCVHP